MARIIQNFNNIDAPDADYPYGKIRDKEPGVQAGTPVNEKVYGDIHQFFAKIMDAASVTANGLPDNDYSGFQFYEAFIRCAVPVGIISMWSGLPNAIPSNYQLCDGVVISDINSPLNGTNTPNLKGKFIVGYDSTDVDYDVVGETGGAKTHTLSAAESGVPAHTHASPAHTHDMTIDTSSTPNGSLGAPTVSTNGSQVNSAGTIGGTAVTISANTAAAAAAAHENRPPYYTMAYIIKIK